MDSTMRGDSQASQSFKLSNGYIPPEGTLTPNAIFVGGLDVQVSEKDMRDFFVKYGPIKEVKIITYRGGICKGYGFVYFSEEVNIKSIIEQPLSFQGRKLKLGPAIMKEKGTRFMGPRPINRAPWMSPPQCFYCPCCSPVGGGMSQPMQPMVNGGSPYNAPYSYPNHGMVMMPQMPVNYPLNDYTYQYTPPQWVADERPQPGNQAYVNCGVQTMLTVL